MELADQANGDETDSQLCNCCKIL